MLAYPVRLIMKRILLLTLSAVMLAACEPKAPESAVDVSKLPPLSGQEIALITAGDVAAQRNNMAQAEQNYLDAVAKGKGRVEAHMALAKLYAKTNELVKAQAILERAHRLQPQHPRVAYLLGKMYLTQNRVPKALEVFNGALAQHPADLDLLVAAGIANDMIPQHATAQALYQRGQSLNPKADLTVLRTNLALSYILTGKAKMAVELLKADAAKPDASQVTRHNLALAYDVLGKKAEAKALLKGELTDAERTANVARIEAYVTQQKGLAAAAVKPAPAPAKPKAKAAN